MWTEESFQYTNKAVNNDSVKKAEEFLHAEIAELKKEIETNELVHHLAFTRPFSSIPAPRDALVLSKERKLYIDKLLKVHDIRKPYIQGDLMHEQIENSNKNEYTMESMPLVLHQVSMYHRFGKLSLCIAL